ncbi:hypothetical protein ACHAWF_000999 [Thalassiosira exigua]
MLAIVLTSQVANCVEAFSFAISSSFILRTRHQTRQCGGALQLASKYIVIGGNIDGINPNKEEDAYSMSKKERRRRERERGEANFKNGNYKKNKKKATGADINYDKLEEKVTRERTPLPRESRETNTTGKKLSVKAARLKKQRTSGGTVNSNFETASPQLPEKQAIQIRVANRGNKTVTMVMGMTAPFKERKILLKEMKSKLGGGGALVEGVLELQGSHSDKVLDMLKLKGYVDAKIVGGK